MKNIQTVIEGDELVIRVKLTERFGDSKSGKTVIVASSEGNQEVPKHPEIKFGLNVYTSKKQ